MTILISCLLPLIFNPISRKLWRNLKEKIRRSKFFFRVREERGEEESVLMGFKIKWIELGFYKVVSCPFPN